MNLKKIIFIAVAMLVITCFTPVYANAQPPSPPHAFYGTVLINGSDAPVGTSVAASADGMFAGVPDNPILITEAGKYGGPGGLDPKLTVQGLIADGAVIDFYVNGTKADQTTAWHSMTIEELDLTATIPVNGGGGGGGGTPPPTPDTIGTDLFGITSSFSISTACRFLKTITATSADGNLTIRILYNALARDAEGNCLSSLTIDVDPSPPPPPAGAHIIGLAYDFGPDGATFNPPITFEYTYDPAEIPEGVAETDLVVAYYNEVSGQWVELSGTVYPATNTIVTSVGHFTTFAVIAPAPPPPPPAPAAFSVSNLSVQPAEAEPEEAVTITVSVANTGGTQGSYTVVLDIDGVKEAEQSVTVAAGGSESVSFSVTREEAGSYDVTIDGLSSSFTVAVSAPPPPPPEPSVNWTLIGAIIAGVLLIVGLVIFSLVRSRRRAC